jgi:5-methyltetrahydrofolate--homocysteine methyltransferase
VENGAQVLDFNFDTDLLDGVSAMGKFMRLCVTDPLISKVPFVIDSSKWDVIEEGLKWVQGKCIVNSTSLKNGEERFLKEAKCCMKHGAAWWSWRSMNKARRWIAQTRSEFVRARTSF